MTTDNWQPGANSIFDGLRRLKLKRQPANDSQVLIYSLLWIGNWQLAARSQFDFIGKNNWSLIGNRHSAAKCQITNFMNWQLAARCQYDFRRVKTVMVNEKPANGSLMPVCTFLWTGNCQLDANSSLQDKRQLKVNTKPTIGSQM